MGPFHRKTIDSWVNGLIPYQICYLNQWWHISLMYSHAAMQKKINSLRPSDSYMVCKLTIIASDNGLSPGRRQAIIWNNAGILSIGLLGTNFSEILIKILTFSFKKMHLNVSSVKWRPFCLGLNVLKQITAHVLSYTSVSKKEVCPLWSQVCI